VGLYKKKDRSPRNGPSVVSCVEEGDEKESISRGRARKKADYCARKGNCHVYWVLRGGGEGSFDRAEAANACSKTGLIRNDVIGGEVVCKKSAQMRASGGKGMNRNLLMLSYSAGAVRCPEGLEICVVHT